MTAHSRPGSKARFAVGEPLVYRDSGSMTSTRCVVVEPPGRPPGPSSALVAFEPVVLGPIAPGFMYGAARKGFQDRVRIDALHRPSPETERLEVIERAWRARIHAQLDRKPYQELSPREQFETEVELKILQAVLEDNHPYISRRRYPHGLRALAEKVPLTFASSSGPQVNGVSLAACQRARAMLGMPPLS